MNRLEKPKTNYTVVPNEIINHQALSPEAKFVYIYLLSKPEGWNVRMTNVQKVMACGRSKTMRCRKELIDQGLLSYQALLEGGGVYTLHGITDVRKPDSGKPDSGFSNSIVSTDKTVITDKEIITTGQTEFDRWWSAYPKKVKKKDAAKVWNRIKPPTAVLIADAQRRMQEDSNWLRGFIPDPTTYLNGERWNDEIRQPPTSELTEADKYELRQRRTAAIVQELNGHDLGDDVAALPPPVDEDEWRDRWSGIQGLVS